MPNRHIVQAPAEQHHQSWLGALAGMLRPAVVTVALGAAMVLAAPTAGAQVRSSEPVRTEVVAPQAALRAEADAAVTRLVTAGGAFVDGEGYGNELGEIDSLARALYDFVNFVNPDAQVTGWGPSTRGDYMSGGLGVGFTLRPKHMTAHNKISEAELRLGAGELVKAIERGPLSGSNQATQDLVAILAAAQSEGLVAVGDQSAALHQIYDASEALLDKVVQLNTAKEKATNNGTALVTHAELLAALPEGSLEHLIAETTLTTDHAAGFFAAEAYTIGAISSRTAKEHGKVGEVGMHYLLIVAKRAETAGLAFDFAAHLQ